MQNFSKLNLFALAPLQASKFADVLQVLLMPAVKTTNMGGVQWHGIHTEFNKIGLVLTTIFSTVF
jgi:hypothetical protein